MIGTIVIAVKNYTCRIYSVRLVVAQFVARLLSERDLRATGGRDREKEFYRTGFTIIAFANRSFDPIRSVDRFYKRCSVIAFNHQIANKYV